MPEALFTLAETSFRASGTQKVRKPDVAEREEGWVCLQGVTVEEALPRTRWWKPWEDSFQLRNSSYSQSSSVRGCLVSGIGGLLDRKGPCGRGSDSKHHGCYLLNVYHVLTTAHRRVYPWLHVTNEETMM